MWVDWIATPCVGEQAVEVRVVAVVEDDEAGVDVPGRRRRARRDRVRVAAEVVGRLEQHDLVLARGVGGRRRCPETPPPTIAILIGPGSRRPERVTQSVRIGRRMGSEGTLRACPAAIHGSSGGMEEQRGEASKQPLADETDLRQPRRASADRAPAATDAVELHPVALRRVLAFAEGRRPVHHRPPRRSGVPDGRGARPPGEHVELDRRPLLPGARLRGVPRAPAGGARGVPPGQRAGAARRTASRRRRCSRSTRPTSRRRWPPITSTSRRPRARSRGRTSSGRSSRSPRPTGS